ncbi:uncharacterized protein LOC131956162 [Physella acuta]|uniref:uncharacterized protein LOC131956162 n=1 Tax=Physella acuta TaxID=109671 RepID=UPI0027DCECEC|nr:uncharacterized protein LOC131956162 [Physella acuta]
MRLVIMKDLTFTGDEPAVKTHRPRIDSTRDFQSEALNFEAVPDFHVIRDDVVSGMELSCLGVNNSETTPSQGVCNVCFVDDDNTSSHADSKTKVDLEQLHIFSNNNNNDNGSIYQDNMSGICIPNSTTPQTCSENNTSDSDISNPGCSNYNCDANKNNQNDIRRRHENGHLLLGHSVSSYIDLHPHGLSNPLEPAPNDDKPGQQLDSGICSEATSAVEHFNNINDDSELKRSASESSLQLALALEQCKDVFLNALRLQETFRMNSLPPNEIQNHELNRNELLSKSSLNAICVYPQVTILTQVKDAQSSIDLEKAQPVRVERHGSYQKRDSVPDDRRFPPNRKLERGISKQKRKKNNERLLKNEACRETLCAKYTSCRWVLAYMCFLARFVQTALRQCMGIAVVGMTLKTTTVVQKSENSTQENSNFTSQNSSTNISFDGLVTFNETLTHQEFEWSSVFEGILLASFNIGSIITPIIVGYLTTR